MIALIDGDLVAFRVAATCNIPDEGAKEIAFLRCDKLIRDILESVNADSYRIFLTGRNNFRKKIYPEYKAHRKDKEKPIYLQDCRDFLIQEWGAEVSEGCEADDLLGMYQTEDTIICTLDKDLDMIPGLHFNWVKRDIYVINDLDALKFFYKQLLIGDTADNIKGVEKVGPVKASKLIDHLDNETMMYEVIRKLYNDDKRLCINMQCLWIWRNEK